jgi:hypothetical protein
MTKFTYVRVRWHHSFGDEPIELWSEIGNDGYETRKLEYFRDGTIGYASHAESTASSTRTLLGDQKFPCIEEIGRDQEFEAELVNKSDFEIRWASRDAE